MRYLQKTFCSRLIISIAVLFIFNGVCAQCPVIDSRKKCPWVINCKMGIIVEGWGHQTLPG